MKVMKVFKALFDSTNFAPNAVSHRNECLIVAENEQDARDSLNPAITMMAGASIDVISVECLGNVSCIVDDRMKE